MSLGPFNDDHSEVDVSKLPHSYLGDGVYAWRDEDGLLWLACERANKGWVRIALDISVFMTLMMFAEEVLPVKMPATLGGVTISKMPEEEQ